MTAHLLEKIDWSRIDIDHSLEHSYKDFHAKGLDYLCLVRTPALTVKAYFFEGDAEVASEVVNPHDHRYPFMTQCYSGTIVNKRYRVPPCWDGESIGDECGPMYNVFHYRTPLLGGNGFEHIDAIPLQQYQTEYAPAGHRYWQNADEFHTIKVFERDTVIVIAQYADVVPEDEPTVMFSQAAEPPNLDGLYSKFKADQLVKRIGQLRELAGKL